MTGREKMRAAFSGQGTSCTPVTNAYPEIFIRDHWAQVTREPWWMMFSLETEPAVRAQRDLLAVTGEDRFRLWRSAPRVERQRYRVEGQDGAAWKLDVQTGVKEPLERPVVSGTHVIPSSVPVPITATAQIDELLPLPPQESAADLAAAGIDEKPKRLLAEFGDRMPWTQLSAPFDPLPNYWGFAGLMLAVAETPELVEHAARRVLEANLRRLAAWRELGAELIWIEDTLADQMSPASYRRFNLQYLRELTAAIRQAGLFSIHYYCGNPHDRLEDLLTSGADALALEESKKSFENNMQEIAKKVNGRMALVGNLDTCTLLESGTLAEIRAEVKRQLDAGRRNSGRFIMGTGSPVTPGTSPERVRALADMVHELTA